MQINSIYIKNFLSFDTLKWPNLDPHLNIIVGPNGAGKTNIIHALRAVKDVLNPNPGQRKSLWSQTAYRGSDQASIKISLDIQFTEVWEKKLLSTFLAATLCNDAVIRDAINKLVSDGNQVSFDMATEQAQFAAFLQEKLSPEDIEWFFTGRLVVEYKGMNTWTSWYELRSEAQSFRLNLDGFSFYGDSVMNRYLQTLLSKQEQFTPNGQLLFRGISSLMSNPSLRVEYSPILLATHRAFEQLTGIPLTNGRLSGASFVFHSLLERALVFSDNLRSQPRYEFPYDDLHNQPIDLSNGEQLARYLLLKKNGSQTECEQYKAIQRLFLKITGRSFEVGFDQSAITTRSSSEEAKVVLSIHVSSDWGDIPLAFSGMGRAEALFLCTLIAARNQHVILLDEPALNMHVTMQRAILNEIQALNENDNQFIIVTHSPVFVSPEAITKVSRFFMRQGHTCCVSFKRNSIDNEEFARLEKELRRSTDARSMLFSRGVILVEGETEQGALPVWFEKRFSSSFESDDIIVFSVNSDTNFSKFVQFLHQFNIPWAIICDGKVIGDCIAAKSRPRIVRQLEKAGVFEISDNWSKDFSQLCQQLEAYRVFTLAKNINDEVEALQIIQSHQQEAKDQVGDSKVRQAQYIAENYDCPDEVATLLDKVLHYLEIHNDPQEGILF